MVSLAACELLQEVGKYHSNLTWDVLRGREVRGQYFKIAGNSWGGKFVIFQSWFWVLLRSQQELLIPRLPETSPQEQRLSLLEMEASGIAVRKILADYPMSRSRLVPKPGPSILSPSSCNNKNNLLTNCLTKGLNIRLPRDMSRQQSSDVQMKVLHFDLQPHEAPLQ